MTIDERAELYIKTHPRENIAVIRAMLTETHEWCNYRARKYVRDFLFQPGPEGTEQRQSFNKAVEVIEAMIRGAI